jgi:hypothetical protein
MNKESTECQKNDQQTENQQTGQVNISEQNQTVRIQPTVQDKILLIEGRIGNCKKPSVTESRKLIALEAERKLALEMLSKESALILDGTGRNVIGKVGGVMVEIGGKIRALTFQRMGNETRSNWADLLIYLLSRIATVSGLEKLQIWMKIVLLISYQCKTNKGLAIEVSKKLGVTHHPGQIFCNIHPVLMMDEKLKKVWQNMQIRIGAEQGKYLCKPSDQHRFGSSKFPKLLTFANYLSVRRGLQGRIWRVS